MSLRLPITPTHLSLITVGWYLGYQLSKAHATSDRLSFFRTDRCIGNKHASLTNLLQFNGSSLSVIPRHNLLQYMGTGLWNSAGTSADSLIAAMHGDNFAVVASVGFEIIRYFLQGFSGPEVAQRMNHSWKSSPPQWLNYVAFGRQHFLRTVANLNASWVTESSAFHLLPLPVRYEINSLNLHLSFQQATCAAKLIMDLSYSARSTQALANHVNEYIAVLDDSMFATLNTMDFSVTDIVYTTVYQPLANSWYGGPITVIFSAGSGIDRFWARSKIIQMNQSGWKCVMFRGRDTCERLPGAEAFQGDRHEMSAYADDAGEVRTPGYKNADEVEGFLYFGDKGVRRMYQSETDITRVIDRRPPLPVQWAFMRSTCCKHNRNSMISILAASLCPEPVFGVVGESCDHCARRYVPSSMIIGLDDVTSPDDLHVASLPRASNVTIPVWGLLYKENQYSSGVGDENHFCDACKFLRTLVDHLSPQMLISLRNARFTASIRLQSRHRRLVSVAMLHSKRAVSCGCTLH